MSFAYPGLGPDDAPRLRDEHAFLERHLGEVIAQAEANDWAGFEINWEAFMSALTQHIKYEESLLLPAYAKSGSAAKRETKRLRTEHESILGQVKFLDGESQLPDILIEQLRYLAKALRKHQEQEERGLYPWLASLRPAENSQAVNKLDACCSPNPQDSTPWKNPLRHEPGNGHSIR